MSKPSAAKSNRVQVIRASAGTGKTFQLTNCLLRLLLQGAAPSSILATTFTRKAAGEILDRVIERLANATSSDAASERLAAELGDELHVTREKIVGLLAKLMRQIDQLRISTLDAYFQKAAKSYAFELGLPFGWDLLNDDETEQVQSDAIRRVLRESASTEIVHLMHLLDKGNLSWKVASQIRATINAARSVFLRCEDGAWKKIEHRKGLTEAELAEALFALEALSAPKENKTYANELSKAIAEARSGRFEHFLTQGVGEKIACGETKYARVEIPADWQRAYEKWVEHAKADFLKWLAIKNEATADLLAKFETQHQLAKRIRRQYAFDDIPRKLAETLRSEEGHQRLAFRLDAGAEHLLLDEFQDTSPEQWRVLAPTAQRICGSKKGAFLCVGDVKQAIYGWRGGSSKIFGAIESQLPNVQVNHLVESYRSSPPVIAAVNRVMEKLKEFEASEKDVPGIRVWSEDFKRHSTAKEDLLGYVTLQEVTAAEGGVKGAKLLAALETAAEVAAKAHAQAPHRTIAILVRRNEPIGRMVHLLRQRGLEASEEGGASLLDSAAVETILSLMQLADHPGDSVARFHLETGPLGKLVSKAIQQPSQFAATLRKSLLEEGHGAFARSWAARLASSCDLRDANRLQQLVELATEYEGSATLRPSDFARFVKKKKVADVVAASIRVMTIHQAKGLEFDTVILPELEVEFSGRVPSCVAGAPSILARADRATRYVSEPFRPLIPEIMQRDHDAEHSQRVQDSMCMLYVGMTRAIHALHMIIPAATAKTKSNWSDLIRFALGGDPDAAKEGLLYSQGDSNWHERAKTVSSIAPDKFTPAPTWPKLRFEAGTPVRARNLARVRPSQSNETSAFNAYAAFNPSSSVATRFGKAIHHWFESIEWMGANSKIDLPNTDLLALGIANTGDDLAGWRTRFEAYLKIPSLVELLSERAFRTRFGVQGDLLVQNEKPLAFLDDGALVSGQIDRLVFERVGEKLTRAWIIDFKTDAIDAKSKTALQERVEHHRLQLSVYRRGIAATHHLPLIAVEAYLVMLEAGIVVASG